MDTPKDQLESGAWVGRQQAFAVIASKCSAAQAAALKEIKQSRAYEPLGLTWQEFCPEYVGMTRERAERMGKHRVIAETGAGQHGVATATVGALLGFECVVYMGTEDMRRQELNVFRMRLLGAEVRGVECRLSHP